MKTQSPTFFIPASRIRNHSRLGMTLLEVSIVLMVTVAALAGGASLYSDYLNGQVNAATAQHMKEVSRAFSRYVTDNHAQLVGEIPGAGIRSVAFADLAPAYLSPAFQNLNPFGQGYRLVVRKPQADRNILEAVVVTEGGEVIENGRALAISQLVGASAGFVPEGGASEVRPAFGNFFMDLHDFNVSGDTSGKLVSALFMNEYSSIDQDYLYRRQIPGRPELNQMNTDLDMGGNNIHNASSVRADGYMMTPSIVTNEIAPHGGSQSNDNTIFVDGNLRIKETVTGNTFVPTLVVVPNSSCLPHAPGSVAKTAKGALLSCQEGMWRNAVGGGCYWNGMLYPIAAHRSYYYDRRARAYAFHLCRGDGTWQFWYDNKD